MNNSDNPKRAETLAEYYYRTYKHLIGDIHLLEYNPENNTMREICMRNFESIIEELKAKGIDATYQTERTEPYVNVGDVKRKKDRMQFWLPPNTDEVHVYVGKEMGAGYAKGMNTPYVAPNYRYSEVECKIVFPGLIQAIEFIRDL